MLAGLASPELEANIIKMALERLHDLKGALQNSTGDHTSTYVVKTVFPLSDPQRELIRQAIKKELGNNPKIEFSTEKSLIAGVEVVLGSTVASRQSSG